MMAMVNATNMTSDAKPSRRARKVNAAEIALSQPLYSAGIIHAGASLSDTKTMLTHWNLNIDVSANLARMQAENVFGKPSRARLPPMLAVFRKRYLADPDTLAALVVLTRDDAPSALLDPFLYLLAVRADPLLRDSVTQFLAPLRSRGQPLVTTEEMGRWLSEQTAAGQTQGTWSPDTIVRLAQGVLSTLRDFGVLEGKVKKRLAPRYLSVRAFALLALYLSREQTTGAKLLRADAWPLFFLDEAAVEQRFLEAHQERLLIYQAAGRVIRIDFPSTSLEEYAHALAQRTL